MFGALDQDACVLQSVIRSCEVRFRSRRRDSANPTSEFGALVNILYFLF